MRKKIKRTNSQGLHVMTTPQRLRTWQNKSVRSGMSLREWVTRTLDAGPVLRIEVKPITEQEGRP